ncbi:MAG TPA: hypothetical protein VFP77_08540, partial [Gemmatimonadaceae bacterium]|nr:hypothetical protein [Gemmatimonadaceae bacterium]
MTRQLRWTLGVFAALCVAPIALHSQTPDTPQVPDTTRRDTLTVVSDPAKPHTLVPVVVSVTR